MRNVRLTDAFSWICESCGVMNFNHPVCDHLTEKEFNELFNAHSQDGNGAYIERPPTIVVCPLCRESFETELEHLEELEG